MSPSLDLQRSVFPWIEEYFGTENNDWRSICNKEMLEVDESEDDGLSDEDSNVDFSMIEEDGREQPKKK